jgi:hypothetical protein
MVSPRGDKLIYEMEVSIVERNKKIINFINVGYRL